jgi:predicted deacetylase
MRLPERGERATAIAVHDVSPATWNECRELLAMLDDAGAHPLSLLVVPHYHHRAAAEHDTAFIRAMEARLARGDELVLHGYFHVDDAPPPRTPAAWFERRMLTRAEGEFAALDERASAWRLARGLAMFDTFGWPLHGFVPPAWLLGAGGRAALASCGHRFAYVTTKQGIYHLPDWRFERTANLWYSPSSAPRRLLSRWLVRRELRRARAVPLLRLSLHPQDVRAPVVMRHWRLLVEHAVRDRVPVTKHEWVDLVRTRRVPIPPAPPHEAARTRAARGRNASPVRAVS